MNRRRFVSVAVAALVAPKVLKGSEPAERFEFDSATKTLTYWCDSELFETFTATRTNEAKRLLYLSMDATATELAESYPGLRWVAWRSDKDHSTIIYSYPNSEDLKRFLNKS